MLKRPLMGHFSALNRPLISDFGTVFEGLLGVGCPDEKSTEQDVQKEDADVRSDQDFHQFIHISSGLKFHGL